jgi:enolase
MTFIDDVKIRKILDSRGNPTVEVEVYTLSGGFGRAAAPAGKSTGKHEVRAYPQGGIDAAIKFLKDRLDNFIGMDATQQRDIDALLHEIDGTYNFSLLGGNIAVAFSLAVAKAAASTLEIPLYRYLGGIYASEIPKPVGNVFGGGKHAINGTTIQEMLAVSLEDRAWDNIHANALVHKTLGVGFIKLDPSFVDKHYKVPHGLSYLLPLPIEGIFFIGGTGEGSIAQINTGTV